MSDVNVSVTEQGTVAVTVGGEAGIAAHNQDADAHAGKDTSGSGASLVGAEVYRDGTHQTIPSSTWTAIECTAETQDTDGFHDNATNPSRLTIPSADLAGTYLVGMQGQLRNLTSGTRVRYALYKNGADTIRQASVTSGAGQFPSLHLVGIIDLADGDYIEGYVWHNQGSDSSSGTEVNRLWMQRIGA